MKKYCECIWKRSERQEEDIARTTHSVSTSVLVGISDSCSVEEMTSQMHYNLGAKLKRSAHADWPCMSNLPRLLFHRGHCQSLWRITRTKTVDGLWLEDPNRGVKQKFEGLYEALSKKHAIEYAKLMK